ncbi:MAG: hypothetical protein J6D54_12305 [Olsenella sp.]|nr:hypothetical protein [Olsenella sp.]
MDKQTASAVAASGILGGMFATMMIVALAFWVLLVIAHWKMFTKAGEAGWKSIIPIYSDYVLFKLVWSAKDFAIFFGASILGCVLAAAGGVITTQNGTTVATSNGNPIFAILALAALIVAIVWGIRSSLKTATAYGKSLGFGIGLILFPNIFTLILGFGSAEYVGPQE